VKILEIALDTWGKDFKYIMWVDADLVFLDMGLKIEGVAASHQDAHILFSAEYSGSTTLVNSGAIIVKNTDFSKMFLKEWWDFADRKYLSDQEQFDLLYKAKKEEYGLAKRIALLPPDAINSDPPAMTKQLPRNQVPSIS